MGVGVGVRGMGKCLLPQVRGQRGSPESWVSASPGPATPGERSER